MQNIYIHATIAYKLLDVVRRSNTLWQTECLVNERQEQERIKQSIFIACLIETLHGLDNPRQH